MSQTKLYSPKYKQALNLVSGLFRDINRDVSGLPFIVHLVGVSYIASRATSDEDVIVASLLHDVLEDIPENKYSEQDMRRDFGDQITDMVKTVSHDDSGDKKKSREKYLEQIRSGTIGACIVSAADMLHNAADIIDSYQDYPDKVRSRFGGERARLRQWFWSERYKILESRLGKDNILIKELNITLSSLEDINTKIM